MGQASKGATPTQIAADLKLTRSAVWYTISIDPLRNEGISQPRAARKKSYTNAEERLIIRHVRLNPKDTYKQVKEACQLSFSNSTIKRILKAHGIGNWRAKRRPLLTEEHAAKRLAWCLARRHWSVEEWGMVCWSDECSCERGRGKRSEWVFRTPAQKWHREMVQTYGTNKNMKVLEFLTCSTRCTVRSLSQTLRHHRCLTQMFHYKNLRLYRILRYLMEYYISSLSGSNRLPHMFFFVFPSHGLSLESVYIPLELPQDRT